MRPRGSVIGPWAIGGGGWEFDRGPQEDEEPSAAIERRLELRGAASRQQRRMVSAAPSKSSAGAQERPQADVRLHESAAASASARPTRSEGVLGARRRLELDHNHIATIEGSA